MTTLGRKRRNVGRTRLAGVLALAATATLAAGAHAQPGQDRGADDARAALEAALERKPDDSALRYELARLLARTGATDGALAEYDTLLAVHPDNADFLLGRAQMLSRLDRVPEALAATGRALALAPDYEDVWQLRLQLARRSGDSTLAETVRAESAARYPDAQWWQLPRPPPTYTRSVTIGYGGDRLSNDTPDWHQRTVRVDWRQGPATYYGELGAAERFGRSDQTLTVGATWQALPQWHIGGGIGGTRDADFAPSSELTIEAQRPWPRGWGSELSFRRREYRAATVSGYAFAVEKYVASFRVAYRLDYSQLHDADSSLGRSLMLNWYPNDRRSLGVTTAAGEEIETIGIDRLLRTSVRSVTLTGRERLSPRLGLDWWLGTHKQGDFYRRDYAGISVRVGF
jgi:YaiO family outer membrane protein